MEWKTVSTLLFSDRDKECEYLNSVYVCEHLCVWTCVERERGTKGKGGKWLRAGRAQKHTPSSTLTLHSPTTPNHLYLKQCSGPFPLTLPHLLPLLPPPLPAPPSLLLTARLPQTHRSVCASCSQSQSRSRSYVCRCPWCRCKWSRSEWWHRRTLMRRPGKGKIEKLRLRQSGSFS